jgi:hypothetical protein
MRNNNLQPKFQRMTEDFKCEKCGHNMKGDGYTNHCSNCLWSKHVDINPGDRMSDCGGMMEPVGFIKKDGQDFLIQKCTKCSHVRNNKVQKQDNIEKVIEISAKNN